MSSARKIAELVRLAPTLLFGSVSTTYRTCGKAECVCHQGERHGPYLHVSYRQGGRTRGYYVPSGRHEQVTAGVRAWKRFQEIADELAERNRIALGLGEAHKRKRRRRS